MHLTTSAHVPAPLDRVFDFFSHAENLQLLTPPWLHFEIRSPVPITMRQGTEIEYRIRLHGIPLSWRSEITSWDPPGRFVDTQIRGPYRRWIHTHRFTAVDGVTLIDDAVDFDVTCGRLIGALVARDLRSIFTYRHGALRRALGLPPEAAPAVTIAG